MPSAASEKPESELEGGSVFDQSKKGDFYGTVDRPAGRRASVGSQTSTTGTSDGQTSTTGDQTNINVRQDDLQPNAAVKTK